MTDEFFMKQALMEASIAFEKNEVPVGAVITVGSRIIARAHNLIELLHDVTAHAEIQCITAAANFLGGKYLNECTLYVTIEPCVMCAGALSWAKIGRVVYGASDRKFGYARVTPNILHPKTEVLGGVLETECGVILKEFFTKKR